MESLNNIVEYIDNMKIKKALFGGFDKESVYSVIQDISSMYQKHISDLQKENSKLKCDIETVSNEAEVSFSDQRQFELAILSAEASKKEVEALNIKLAEAEDTIESAKEEMLTLTKRLKEAETRAAAAEKTVRELENKVDGNEETNSFIQQRFETLDAAIRVVRESEERAVADARQKADTIIDDAKQEANRIVEDGAKEYERISREVIILKEMKNDMERSVAEISFQIKDLYFKTDELRRKYDTEPPEVQEEPSLPLFDKTEPEEVITVCEEEPVQTEEAPLTEEISSIESEIDKLSPEDKEFLMKIASLRDGGSIPVSE